MKEEKIKLEFDKQEKYLVDLINSHSLSLEDILELIEWFASYYIRLMCKAKYADTDKVLNIFLGAIRTNVNMMKMSEEVDAGGNVDTIVNKYFKDISPDIRNDYIKLVRMESGNNLLSSITLDEDE